jgi:riboflavin kinase/FMN adenylyltransferase
MQVHLELSHLPKFTNAVITTGSFDGVHTGHLQIIGKMKEISQQVGGETVLITFHPHPRKVISSVPGDIKQLTSLQERIPLLEKAGVDHLVVVNFDYRFSNLSAIEYINDFLVAHFHPNTILVGYDHHFGKGRNGNTLLLKTEGEKQGFNVVEIHEYLVASEIVSSTLIRSYILDKNFVKANALLGYPYQFNGFVVRGNQLGRTIGYPTANLHIIEEEKLLPSNGVYAVKVKGDCTNGRCLGGMMNIGVRPTVDGHKKVIEVNIFNFDEEIYEQNITVLVYEYLRGEQKFNGLEELKAQLSEDKQNAMAILEQHPSS